MLELRKRNKTMREYQVTESGSKSAVITVIENCVEVAKYYATRGSKAGLNQHSYTISGGKSEELIRGNSFEHAAMVYSLRN